MALFALFASGVLGAKAFMIVAIGPLSAHAYSAPPLRLRLRLGSNLFIGWGSFLMFYLGYFAWTTIGEWPHERVPVSVSLIILAALSLGTLTKDAKDYEGDLGPGPARSSRCSARRGAAASRRPGFFLSLLTPLALFRGPADVLVFTLIAVAAAFGFERSRRLIVPFAAYAVAFAYAVARTAGLIGGGIW